MGLEKNPLEAVPSKTSPDGFPRPKSVKYHFDFQGKAEKGSLVNFKLSSNDSQF